MSAIDGILAKTPDEAIDIAFDWSDRLESGETASLDLGWSAAPPGLILAPDPLEGAQASARISGGEAGRIYRLGQRLQTSGGRVLERGVSLSVLSA